MDAPKSNPSQNAFRPPPISLGFGLFWAFVTYQLLLYGDRGLEAATLAACVTGLVSIGQLAKALNDQLKIWEIKKNWKAFVAASPDHGDSRFATPADVSNSDIFNHQQGIFLGSMQVGRRRYRDVFCDSNCAISITAPPGESKSTGIICPSVCAGIGQNLIINDVSGELLSILKPVLELQGYEVITVAPFPNEVATLIGQPVRDAGLDIFSSLSPDMPVETVSKELLKANTWLLPGKVDMEEKSEYFYRCGRKEGQFFNFRDMVHGRKPTLTSMRAQLTEGMSYMDDLFTEAAESDAFGGLYADLARTLLGLKQTAPLQFAGGHGVLEAALDPYAPQSELGIHTSKSVFDPRTLKDGSKKQAVFLVYTLGNFTTYSAPMAMSLTYMFDTVASVNGTGRVTALVDEVGALVMPKLSTALSFYRKMNLRCVLVWQDMAQAERNLGKAAMREIMAASKVKVAMGLQEPEVLEMFSKLCGTQGIEDMSINEGSILNSSGPDHVNAFSHRSLPLMRPEGIRTMDDMLVIGGRMRPLRLKKVRYWE